MRGSWSARDDRTASAVWLGILWIGMIAGFGVDLHRFLHQNPPAPVIVHVHAFIFTVWMFLLTAQVLLVVRDRVALHRKLGWLLVAWAGLMAIFGPWAELATDALYVNIPGATAFLSVSIVDMCGFLVLFAWGIALRKNPAAHRRMMILSTLSLATAGFLRFSGFVLHKEPTSVTLWFLSVFYGNVLLIALILLHDILRRRLMRSFVLGAAGLLAADYAASFLYFWKPWSVASTRIVELWMKL